MDNQVGKRAVVLGGSMAGLLAARVLADAYADVVVVDRDTLTGVTDARRGVPQGRHAHALLARGSQILDELFPGLTRELAEAGIPQVDMGEMHWHLEGQRLANFHTGLNAVSVARPNLESHVRARVSGIPNVTFAEETDITGLETTADRSQVTGVRIHDRAPDIGEQVLAADLVVHALGRGERMSAWLSELGYQSPEKDEVKIRLAYTSCEFMLPSRPLENDRSIISLATPMSRHGAFFGRVGGDRHQLSLTSMQCEPPSADIEGVMECAKSLPVPAIYAAIREGKACTEPVTIRFPNSVRHRYEQLTRFPERLLLVGDGVCSFNPVYGQGMTVAALEALVLRRHLRRGQPPRPRPFFRDIAKVIDAPWAIAGGGDLAWPGVEGRRTMSTRMMNAYMGRMMFGMLFDDRITNSFMRVAGLVDHPRTLLYPRTLYRVLKQSRHMPKPG
jgi:2-polyprenyl-6-methoxyphenol hydroxylase-like FAD-dependent oxidoreductase